MKPSTSYLQRISLLTPINTTWEPLIAQQCIVGLFAIEEALTLQIRAKSGEISWCVDVPHYAVATVENHFYSLYPAVEIPREPKAKADVNYFTYELQAAAPFVGPLNFAVDFKELDPLAGILTVMSTLQKEEEFILCLTLSPLTKDYQRIGRRMITESRHAWWHFLTPHMAVESFMWQSMMGVQHRLPKYEPDIQKAAESKLRMPLKESYLIVKIQATSQQRADELLMQLASPAAVYGRDGLNFLVTPSQHSYKLILSAPEIAALWHLPNEACKVPGISWVMDKHVPPPVELSQVKEGIVLGTSSYHGRQIDVRTADADRVTHINLIGRTRTGKSTLLHNMIHQDIQQGKGVGVIDPHGDLIEDILEKSIPRERENDVVLFDWSEEEKVIGLNPLHVPEGVDVATAATHTLAIFRKFFGDAWIEGRMEDTVYACLVSLMSVRGSVVQDITRILVHEEFRRSIVKQLTDLAALDYWHFEYEPANQKGKLELARPVNTRIRRFYRDKTLRRIVGQADCLDFGSILSQGKIFLANMRGANTLEGDSIGSLLITQFQMAAMSRALLKPSERLPFYLYIDEVQNFVVTSLPEMLSEAAKFGINLVIANQFMGQLSGDTAKAVLGNVGTNIMFRSGKDEADLFSALLEPTFSRDDLLNLSRYKAIIKTQHQGTTLSAFLVSTNPPPQPIQQTANVAEHVRNQSRQKYGKPAVEIDAELAQRYQNVVNTSKGNGKDKQAPDNKDFYG